MSTALGQTRVGMQPKNGGVNLSVYLLEAWYEFLAVLRVPGFALPTIAFPLMFYLFFGVVFGSARGNTEISAYLVATYGTFGVISPALFGFGVGMAMDRSAGWLLLKQVSPMPPGAYFAAKAFMSVLFAMIIASALFALSATMGNVRFRAGQWTELFLILSFGTLPFCAMGLAIGSWTRAKAAVAIVNLIYLPMSFLSGLWMPISALPDVLKQLALLMPPYHLSQLALRVIDMDQGHPVALHLEVVAVPEEPVERLGLLPGAVRVRVAGECAGQGDPGGIGGVVHVVGIRSEEAGARHRGGVSP